MEVVHFASVYFWDGILSDDQTLFRKNFWRHLKAFPTDFCVILSKTVKLLLNCIDHLIER